MVAEPIQPAAAGWQAAANALPENMRKRVRRVFQPQNLMIQERLPDAYDEGWNPICPVPTVLEE